MTAVSLPPGWEEIEKGHPEDGVVAHVDARYQHAEGVELIIWSGVVEDASDYTVSDDDEYAFELYAENGDYIEGDAFETKRETIDAATKAMSEIS